MQESKNDELGTPLAYCDNILGEYGRANVVEIRPARVSFEASNVTARNGDRVRERESWRRL